MGFVVLKMGFIFFLPLLFTGFEKSFAQNLNPDLPQCSNELDPQNIDPELKLLVDEVAKLRLNLSQKDHKTQSTEIAIYDQSREDLIKKFVQAGFTKAQFETYFIERLDNLRSEKESEHQLELQREEQIREQKEFQKKRLKDPLFGRTKEVVEAIKNEVFKLRRSWGEDLTKPITLKSLSSINELSLSGLGITSLKPDDFEGLELSKLDLSDNALTELPKGMFDQQKDLYRLCLQNNDLKELSEDVFKNLTRLYELNLSGNDLRSLPKKVFWSLVNLNELNLAANDLEDLDDDIFKGLKNLNSLNLASNLLEELRRATFWNQGLVKLEHVAVAGNPFKRPFVPVKVFKRLNPDMSYRLSR